MKFNFNEKYLSQIPALQLLISSGYIYLSPEKALAERQGKTSNVILEGILAEQLKRINRINYKRREYLFSEENIQSAVQKLKNVQFEGIHQTAEAAYDLLTLGTTLEQNIEGDTKSFSLQYIDWKDWTNNIFHVTAEYSVERSGSYETARPDIVLFVNGIPFSTIECKSPKEEVEQAISQTIRNQRADYIPALFSTVQIVLGVNKNEALYATTGTPRKFWSVWQELEDNEDKLKAAINTALSNEDKDTLFTGDFAYARHYFDELESAGNRLPTVQDQTIFSLLQPKRLLDIAYRFIVFEGGIKKIARYQQYFVVHSAVQRVKQRSDDGKRKGGIVWHTQGSGKSLTMVMMARTLALDEDIKNPRIVLVTDRVDLDQQLSNTFAACGLKPNSANSGRELLKLIGENKSSIITTLIHKFDKALNVRDFRDESSDIFILVDESHRTNFGSLAAQMRKMLPNACYIGFTGTPILKKEKNNIVKFGGLIEPHYSIQQAVKDKAVVPLLYEGRHVEMEQNKQAIDIWFERHTQGLSDAQKTDLKRKYARAEMLNKADQVIYMRAFDISEHYRASWQGTGFKAQLVAPSKAAAIRYHDYLNEMGLVSSEVIISPPDAREGYEEVEEESKNAVQAFWKKMMARYGTEKQYNDSIIGQFKNGEHPEILIVVDKLLTGFDAPRSAVLYVCRTLREHTLLQAIARVNRLYEDEETGQTKDFGYIVDYVAVLGELDQALTMYAEAGLDNYDEKDIAGTLASINDEVSKLPQLNSNLWDIFKTIPNKQDEEAFELFLEDEERRDAFYEALNEYSKCLAIALSSEKFITETPDSKLRQYKSDLQRFQNLRASVKLRYAESVDYRKDYEPKLKKLLDTHIQANEVIQLNEPINIFDEDTFKQLQRDQGVFSGKSTAAKADAIAHATKRVIIEKLDEDPAFYEKFSKLIQQAIDGFRNKRLTDLEYLKSVSDIRHKIVNKVHDDAPEVIATNDDALAFYGVLLPYMGDGNKDQAVEASKAFVEIFKKHKKVNFWNDDNAKKAAMNDIDDYLYDVVKGEYNIDLPLEVMDQIIEKSMRLAKSRMPHE